MRLVNPSRRDVRDEDCADSTRRWRTALAEHLQQLGCLDVVAHLTHGGIWKLMVLAQN